MYTTPDHQLIAQLLGLLVPVSEIETNPYHFSRSTCPICERNHLRDAPRVYCEFKDNNPENEITRAVVACYPCLNRRRSGLQTLGWTAFLHRLLEQERQSRPPMSLSAEAFRLAKAVHDARDLRGLEDDGCALCDNCWEDDKDLMVMCSLDADDNLEHYVMVCATCGSQIPRDDDVVLLPIAEFRTRILAQMAK